MIVPIVNYDIWLRRALLTNSHVDIHERRQRVARLQYAADRTAIRVKVRGKTLERKMQGGRLRKVERERERGGEERGKI
jgi:hypothetical protein